MGTVVTFLDRDRRILSGTVTELRRLEIVVADAETSPSRVRYARLRLIKAGFTRVATMQHVAHHAARLLERHLNTGAPANRWRFRFDTATGRARICPYPATTIALLVSYVLRAPCDDIRDTLPHEIAPAIAGPGHAHDAVWQAAARRIGSTANRCSTVTRGLKQWIAECPPVPRPMVPSTPDRHRTPTLDLLAVPLPDRLENQRPRGRPWTATRKPSCQDYSYDLKIDSMATAKRPSADLRRPRGREAISTHPPAPVDDTPRGSLEQQPAEHADTDTSPRHRPDPRPRSVEVAQHHGL